METIQRCPWCGGNVPAVYDDEEECYFGRCDECGRPVKFDKMLIPYWDPLDPGERDP